MAGGLVFGFDLGTNSVGWAVLREDGEGRVTDLVDMGSRIFIKAVEDKTPTPKNQKRRRMRLMRRVIQRRARRRQRLQNYLIRLSLLPESVRDISQREAVLNGLGDPYALRAKGLDVALTARQLGRALLHLGMRRGFQSNRKTLLSDMADDPDVVAVLAEMEEESEEGRSDADRERIKEEGEFKAAISALQGAIDESGARTLGEFLSRTPGNERKRNRRVGREMMRHELQALLAAQAPHHAVLDEAVRDEIEHVIFFQRPLRWDSATIGSCSLEPKYPRAARGRLEFQRFRILQDLNHLLYDYPQIDPGTGEIRGLGLRLTDGDRAKLMGKLDKQRTMSWSAIRKEIGLPKTVRFNLEEGSKDKGLHGNGTACSIRGVIGDDKWENLGTEGQHALVEDLLKFEKKSALKRRLIGHWQFDVRTAIGLVTLELEPGHANLSLKAIRRILPFLEQGMIYSDARQAARYGFEAEDKAPLDRLPRPGDLRNPVVNKALHEFRRVCNAMVATYGKPAAIRIELPRELTMNRKRKIAYEKQQKENQKANEKAKEQYDIVRQSSPQLYLPGHPRRDDLIKYRLWQEQGCVSAYSGAAISVTQLFSAAVEIDHILPYSRSLDDSYMNKVVAFATENRNKGNRTPWEAYSGLGEAWEQVVQRARHFPLPKRERLLRQQLEGVDGFINSQLTDTAYISREVTDYVRQLGCDVSVSKGPLTAWLRHRWGLNPLLGDFEKNRTDHRHHAIDATVIAAVNRSLYRRIVHLAEQDPCGGSPDVIAIDTPFEGFRNRIEERLATVIVSHDPVKKLTGAFHEATACGVQKTGESERIVYRKPLGPKFDGRQIAKVADPALRDFLGAHLAKFGNDPKVAFSDANRPRLKPNAAAIRHVRVIDAESFNSASFLAARDRAGRVYKFYPFGNNHHIEILRDKASGRFRGVFVNTWEAAQRARRDKQPLVQRNHDPESEFVMALHINDLVEIERQDHVTLYRVQQLDPRNNRLVLRLHSAATLDDAGTAIVGSIQRLAGDYKMRPLRINILGVRLDDQASS